MLIFGSPSLDLFVFAFLEMSRCERPWLPWWECPCGVGGGRAGISVAARLEPGAGARCWSQVLEPGAGARCWSQVLEPGAGAAARAPPGGGDGVHDDGT